MASVVILAIVSFLICEKVVSAMSERIKFLLSLKHLSLFFLISLREGGRRSAREVEKSEVVKKLDSRFTYIRFIFVWIYDCITIYKGGNIFSLDI
jgi:hypothetical protein